MVTSVLLLGFVLGMRHALEADHLAAVSALVSRRRDLAEMTRLGAVWGIGHTLALIVVSGAVMLSPWRLPEGFWSFLELTVGGILVALGAQVLYRLWRDRFHVHAHRHDGGGVHLHAHSHRGDAAPHAASLHHHRHPAPGWKSLVVGLAHGAAGSAALTVYVAASLKSPWTGLVYMVLFGLGSIVGMALLSAVIALPLTATATATNLTWANRGLQALVGLASIAIGLRLALLQGVELWF